MEDLGDETPLDVPRSQQENDGEGDQGDSDSDTDCSVREDLNAQALDFYDPDLDDQDAEWVANQRQQRKSDAILSCPCCLTTLCIDCQQHTELECQFRAMFVMNCRCVWKWYQHCGRVVAELPPWL
jgi:E2F-associated phosphoprotein